MFFLFVLFILSIFFSTVLLLFVFSSFNSLFTLSFSIFFPYISNFIFPSFTIFKLSCFFNIFSLSLFFISFFLIPSINKFSLFSLTFSVIFLFPFFIIPLIIISFSFLFIKSFFADPFFLLRNTTILSSFGISSSSFLLLLIKLP